MCEESSLSHYAIDYIFGYNGSMKMFLNKISQSLQIFGLRLAHSRKTPNDYFSMQESYYERGSKQLVEIDHEQHNSNPQLHRIGFSPLCHEIHFFQGKNALDFGCGGGRNLRNIAQLNIFTRIDGVDISSTNVIASKNAMINAFPNILCDTFKNSFDNLGVPKSQKYSFVFSTITFQHIASRSLRNKIFSQIYDCLEQGGYFRFQMGFNGTNLRQAGTKKRLDKFTVSYFANFYGAPSTNGDFDVSVTKPSHVISDLLMIGFQDIDWEITPSWRNSTHDAWIWFSARKRSGT
jgi:SAM-dependent methyltransferase